MFSQIQVAAIKNTYAQFYEDTMTICELEPYDVNGITRFRVKDIKTNIPCRLSHSSNLIADGDYYEKAPQTIKVFCDEKEPIKQGSILKITLHNLNLVHVYEAASKPRYYVSHQEVSLRAKDDLPL